MLRAILLLASLAAEADAAFSDFTSSGLAEWSTSGVQQWTLNSGRTPSNPTGPTAGRSGGSDNYYFLETSPGQAGDAGLLSYQGSGEACNVTVTFWYHMYGADMGTLSILRPDGSSVWARTGDAGDSWQRATAAVGSSTFSFQGTRGSGCAYTRNRIYTRCAHAATSTDASNLPALQIPATWRSTTCTWVAAPREARQCSTSHRAWPTRRTTGARRGRSDRLKPHATRYAMAPG